jgi:regulator of extracellular matrix RemA (YlzA/DUF370 family)
VFVHLGGDAVVDVRDVVAILNIQRVAKSESLRDLIERAQKTRPDMTKQRTLVVCTRSIFLSAISPETVASRFRRMASPGPERMARKQTGQGFPPLTPGPDK